MYQRSKAETCLTTAMFALEYADEIAKLSPTVALQKWSESPHRLKEFVIVVLELESRGIVSDEAKEAIEHELTAHQSTLQGEPYKKQKAVMVELLDSIHTAISEIALKDYLSCACEVAR